MSENEVKGTKKAFKPKKKLFKNFYIVVGSVFILWMVFFFFYSYFAMRKQKARIHELEDQKKYYNKDISKMKRIKTEIDSSRKTFEKYAREDAFYKKPSEEIFIDSSDVK